MSVPTQGLSAQGPELLLDTGRPSKMSDVYALGMVRYASHQIDRIVLIKGLRINLQTFLVRRFQILLNLEDLECAEISEQETFTGQIPFADKADPAVVGGVMYRRLIPSRPGSIPEASERGDELWELLVSCWSFEPEHRPSAQHVENIVSAILRS
jgi:hypothetical protein